MLIVDLLLIILFLILIKDLYVIYLDKNISESKIKKILMCILFLIGILVFIFFIKLISLIVWVNLFVLGG